MKYFLTVIAILSFVSLKSQTNTYNSLTNRADSLFKTGKYRDAALTFSEAFKLNNGKGRIDHRYVAGAAWARAGQADSAFFQLEKIANSGNSIDYVGLKNDTSFNLLHQDARWPIILKKLKKVDEVQNAELDVALDSKLEMVYREDQKYRASIDSLIKKEGIKSLAVQEILGKMHRSDSVNLITVSEILDKHGWLGPKTIGKKGSLTLFLVIQHSDLKTQSKYLPMLRRAVKIGDAEAVDLAFLEDRVLLQQNKRQVYGTQIGTATSTGQKYVLPLLDPLNVDKRRADIGLEPLANYVSQWNIVWNPKEYENQLAKINKQSP